MLGNGGHANAFASAGQSLFAQRWVVHFGLKMLTGSDWFGFVIKWRQKTVNITGMEFEFQLFEHFYCVISIYCMERMFKRTV